jgi:hypothetical protein
VVVGSAVVEDRYGELVEAGAVFWKMEDVTGLLETMFVLVDETESSPVQAVIRRTSAAIAIKREVAVESTSSESQNWRHDLVIVEEILLAGNHYIVMMNSYPTFMFMKYICI